MPALFVLFIRLCVYMLTLDGIGEGLSYYLIPNFYNFFMSTVLGAMGQPFYSLSLTMGFMITYGSYMRKHVNIERSAQTICLTDTSVAFLSGLLVVPAVIVFNDTGLSSGPGLIFNTMPLVFK